jgi:hypothetical protein
MENIERNAKKGVVQLAISNTIKGTGEFPIKWRVAQIIMIPKPGKPLE